MDKPLISLCVPIYNVSPYWNDLFEGIVSQTYSPLEVIFSDDCSTDNSYEIIQEAIKNYSGNQTFILHRNEQNLGIFGNRNVAFSLASGKWLISQDCDDISLPNRVSVIYEGIKRNSDKNISLIATSFYNINQNGKLISNATYDFKKKIYLTGAVFAYRRDMYDIFGNIGINCLDDVVYVFRALLLGNILIIDTPTVKNRENDDFLVFLRKEIGYLRIIGNSFLLRDHDLEQVKDKLNYEVYLQIKKINQKFIDLTSSDKYLALLESKEKKIELYGLSNLIEKLQRVWFESSFSTTDKLKLFLNSFRFYRLLKPKLVSSKNKFKSFTGNEYIITINDAIEKTIMLSTINDIDY